MPNNHTAKASSRAGRSPKPVMKMTIMEMINEFAETGECDSMTDGLKDLVNCALSSRDSRSSSLDLRAAYISKINSIKGISLSLSLSLSSLPSLCTVC